jgi:hypothetical protein
VLVLAAAAGSSMTGGRHGQCALDEGATGLTRGYSYDSLLPLPFFLFPSSSSRLPLPFFFPSLRLRPQDDLGFRNIVICHEPDRVSATDALLKESGRPPSGEEASRPTTADTEASSDAGDGASSAEPRGGGGGSGGGGGRSVASSASAPSLASRGR